MGRMFSDGPSLKPEMAKSSPQSTAVGSGDRPTKSKIMIETSSPADPKTLGRDVAGSLK